MNRRFQNRLHLAMSILVLSGLLTTNAWASTFGAIVRDPAFDFDDAIGGDYEVFMDTLARKACHNATTAGWTVAWYSQSPPVWRSPALRHNGDTEPFNVDCTPYPTYVSNYRQARDIPSAPATMVLFHARRNLALRSVADRHPFQYVNQQDPFYTSARFHGIFDQHYSLMHNGSLPINRYFVGPNERDGLRNRIGPNFGALHVFNDRPFTDWAFPVGDEIDTEYYAMLLMKYLLVQKNYYWEGVSNDPPYDIESSEEWAIRRLAQDFPSTDWVPPYTRACHKNN